MERRTVLASMAALLGSGSGALAHSDRSFREAISKATNLSFREAMPMLVMNEGSWEGEYRLLNQSLEPMDNWTFRIDIKLGDGPEAAYVQNTVYRWQDGRERKLELIADYRDGALHFGNERLTGIFWQASDDLLVAEMRFAASPGLVTTETVRMAADGSARTRLGNNVRNGKLESILLISEERVA